MKRITISLIAIACSLLNLLGQVKEGTITYKQTIYVHKNLKPAQLALKAFLPETIDQIYKYSFNQESGYISKGDMTLKGGEKISIKMNNGNDEAFYDYSTKTKRSYIKDGETFYYSESPIFTKKLEKTQEKKMILNFKCTKYIIKGEPTKTSYWITKELPNYISPFSEVLAKGAILEIDNEKFSFTAASLDKKVDKTALNKYKKAIKITKEQFEDLSEELNVYKKYE